MTLSYSSVASLSPSDYPALLPAASAPEGPRLRHRLVLDIF
ncbi:MAG: hypothetical protein PQJ50_16150 [Spirochaetales bacterium]|nr:hypothetical protein [Spirochaetales bacterium]